MVSDLVRMEGPIDPPRRVSKNVAVQANKTAKEMGLELGLGWVDVGSGFGLSLKKFGLG